MEPNYSPLNGNASCRLKTALLSFFYCSNNGESSLFATQIFSLYLSHSLSFFFFLPSIQFIFSILFWYSFPSEHGSDNIHGSSALKEEVVAAFQSCVYVQRTLWICFSFPVIFGFCSRNACSVLKALFFSLGSSMLTSHDI